MDENPYRPPQVPHGQFRPRPPFDRRIIVVLVMMVSGCVIGFAWSFIKHFYWR